MRKPHTAAYAKGTDVVLVIAVQDSRTDHHIEPDDAERLAEQLRAAADVARDAASGAGMSRSDRSQLRQLETTSPAWGELVKRVWTDREMDRWIARGWIVAVTEPKPGYVLTAAGCAALAQEESGDA